MDSTTVDQTDNAPHQQTVSGASAFWALSAIASHAMLQPSFTGYLWNGKSFEGSLWPHRSSPFVCIVDTGAEIFITFRALRNQDPIEEESKPATVRNGALTKVALFCFGAMPQALKLFSMRGIPVTQAAAAMFLLSSTVSVVRSLMVESPQQEIQEVLESVDGSGLRSKRSVKAITFVLGWGPHLVGLFLVWYGLVGKVGFAAPADLANAVDWVLIVFTFLALAYIIQHAMFMLMDKKPPIPRYPIIMVLLYTNIFCCSDLLKAPGTRINRGISGRWAITIQFLVSLGFACYTAAVFLAWLVDRVYSPCKRCGRLHWRLVKRWCLAEDANSPFAATEGSVSEGSRTATDSTQTGANAQTPPAPRRVRSDDNQTAPYTGDEDTTAEQQRAAEEGAIDSSAVTDDQADQDQVPVTFLRSIVNFVLIWILKLMWRLMLTYLSLFVYTFNWMHWQVTEHRPPKILMMGFGLANLVTVALYYLVFFDGDGTAAPGWSNNFG